MTTKFMLAAIAALEAGSHEQRQALNSICMTLKGRSVKIGDITRNVLSRKFEVITQVQQTTGGVLVKISGGGAGDGFYLGNNDRIDVYRMKVAAQGDE